MNYTIKNTFIEVAVADKGAELQSIKSADGHEYLWQGDPEIWKGRAYNLFPTIGKMYDGKYTTGGEVFQMPPHGVVRQSTLNLIEKDNESMTFELKSNDYTKQYYPFDFTYRVCYTLQKNAVRIVTTVINDDKKVLPFGIGGHPGFFVPMEEGKSFENYFVFFPKATSVKRLTLDKNVYFTGLTPKYALDNGKLHLRHEELMNDAIVLEGSGDTAIIACENCTRKVIFHYPNIKYLGVWHIAKMGAPYICLEPWTMMPASISGMDDFDKKDDIFHLQSGEQKSVEWTIEVV